MTHVQKTPFARRVPRSSGVQAGGAQPHSSFSKRPSPVDRRKFELLPHLTLLNYTTAQRRVTMNVSEPNLKLLPKVPLSPCCLCRRDRGHVRDLCRARDPDRARGLA